jgi:anti-sigma B factor antagonist
VREFIDDGLHVLQIGGEVDMAQSPALREVLATHVEARRAALLLDFTEVQYIDSSGLATLVEYVQLAAPHGGRLAVGGLNESVRTVFEMVRLGEIFTVRPVLEEARAALRAEDR